MRLWHIVNPPRPLTPFKNVYSSLIWTRLSLCGLEGGWSRGGVAELSGSVLWRICRTLSGKHRQRDFQQTSLQPDLHWVLWGRWGGSSFKERHLACVKMPFFFSLSLSPDQTVLPPPQCSRWNLGNMSPLLKEHLIALVMNSHTNVSCSKVPPNSSRPSVFGFLCVVPSELDR